MSNHSSLNDSSLREYMTRKLYEKHHDTNYNRVNAIHSKKPNFEFDRNQYQNKTKQGGAEQSINTESTTTSDFENKPIENKPNDAEDVNIYINIEKFNPIDNMDEITMYGMPAESNITQSSAILANPSDYRITMERFSIPSNLPLFIYPPEEIAQELYQVEVLDSDTGIYSVQPLLYQDIAPALGQYPRGIYYYNHLLSFINRALIQAYTECNYEPDFPVSTENAVQLVYEPQTELFYFEVPSDFTLYFSGRIQIRLSLALYINFFPSFYAGFIIDPVDLPMNIIFVPTREVLVGSPVFKQYNQTPCIGIWNTVSKLLILSNTIPVNNEIISSSNQKTQTVLFDFEVAGGVASTLPYQYYPNLHRWYDFNSTQPLQQLQIAVQVVFKDGSNFPLLLQRGEYFSIKLLVRSKKSQLTN